MHLKFKGFIVLATALFVVSPVFSQKNFKPFGSMSLGVKASTMGYGIEVATPLHNLLILRLGASMTNGIKIGEQDFVFYDNDGEFMESFGYVPNMIVKPGINFTHGSLLLDFHPAGIFHLTLGAFAGKSQLRVDGHLVDRNGQPSVLQDGVTTWPSLKAGDQRIDLTDGQASVDLLLGNNFKPYLGLGLGRAVSKNSRLSFKFELGLLYQGRYTLRQNGIIFDLAATEEPDLEEVHDFLVKYGVFWPMLNFQLSYRIF